MKAAVVDASVAVKWVVQEPGSDHALRLASFELSAPSLLLVECANALWVKVQRGELTADEGRERSEALRASSVILMPLSDLVGQALKLAFELGHPVYDCCYLAAAIRASVPVVTADGKFIDAIRANPLHAGRVVPLNELA